MACQQDRLTRGLMDFRAEAKRFQIGLEKASGILAIGGMGWLGTHAGNAQQRKQPIARSRQAGIKMIKNSLYFGHEGAQS
jgi:hypothetical protein